MNLNTEDKEGLVICCTMLTANKTKTVNGKTASETLGTQIEFITSPAEGKTRR